MHKIEHGDGAFSIQRTSPSDLNEMFLQARRYRALRTLATMPEATQQMAFDLVGANDQVVISESEFDRRVDKLLQIVGM